MNNPAKPVKQGKYERGESVPLKDLPREVQENVKNPPESVQKVRKEMEKQSEMDLEDLYTDGDEETLTAEDYTALLHQGKFERGKSMTPEEVSKVVGPEFKENVDSPPPEVKKLKEEMKKKACGCEEDPEEETDKTAANRTTHMMDPQRKGFDMCGQHSSPQYSFKSIKDADCYYCKQAWEKMHSKTAASGLYGATKDLEGVCLSAGRKLASSVKKIAREIYSKDEEVPGFLSEHGKRTGNRAAKLLVAAFKDMGPGSKVKAAKTAGPARTGLYGFKERTAKIALEACSALYHQAGLIAGDLHGRRTANYEGITGFFKQHSKSGKCGYSALLLEAYPSAPAQKVASFMLNETDWTRYLQAADFLASEEEEEEETEDKGSEKKANLVAIGDAKRFIDALALLMSGDFEGSVFGTPEEVEAELITILKRSMQHGDNISLFIYELGKYGKRVLLPLLSGMKPDPVI